MELEKSYDHKKVEVKWVEYWEEKKLSTPEVASKLVPQNGERFCIVIPPPNVTGVLHIGHALNTTLQDILVRFKRMQGFKTLWIPGTDHAGIATQNVVERELLKEGKKKEDLGREEFLKRVWKWKEEKGGTIIKQLKALGASCDWTRERFTMSENLSRAVRKVFATLYKKGLIYKGKYMVNWCPRCKTALANDEVEHLEEKGKLWYIKYPLEDGSGYVVVATTRPETMLGDTAVAVNPNDERYSHLVGKFVILPIMNRKIPVIADEFVDPEFGTGVVKITPAHDPADYEAGIKHGLDFIQVIDENGIMTEEAGEFAGLDRYEARQKIVERLEKEGLIEKIEDYTHAVGTCYRCSTVIEPLVSDQWFVKMKPLAEKAMEAVKSGKIKFIPEHWENLYFSWLENIRDWCISRQIWWGHRIPVWYCQECGHLNVAEEDPKTCEKCGSSNLVQDDDVLDTWFSSALWPFSTLGWPDETEDLKEYYPTDVLVTGFDIIYFWVARMIMMGLEFMKKEPFKYVYLHALVRDEYGRKMSKSLGNAVDPLEIIETHGADALRFTLAALAMQGRDILFAKSRLDGYRTFLNKIWNATRFVLIRTEGYKLHFEGDIIDYLNSANLAPEDRWILKELENTIKKVTQDLEDFRFAQAANAIYSFFWDKFCDWYIEFSKLREDNDAKLVLLFVLASSLKVLHPFIPFITEELWHYLPEFLKDQKDLIVSSWPKFEFSFESAKEIEAVIELIKSIRTARSIVQLKPKDIVDVFVEVEEGDGRLLELFFMEKDKTLKMAKANLKRGKPTGKFAANPFTFEGTVVQVHLALPEGFDTASVVKRLEKRLKEVENNIKRSEGKLANENFVKKAPPLVVEKEKTKLEELKAEKEQLEKVLAGLR